MIIKMETDHIRLLSPYLINRLPLERTSLLVLFATIALVAIAILVFIFLLLRAMNRRG